MHWCIDYSLNIINVIIIKKEEESQWMDATHTSRRKLYVSYNELFIGCVSGSIYYTTDTMTKHINAPPSDINNFNLPFPSSACANIFQEIQRRIFKIDMTHIRYSAVAGSWQSGLFVTNRPWRATHIFPMMKNTKSYTIMLLWTTREQTLW